jgi:hypothetical protein
MARYGAKRYETHKKCKTCQMNKETQKNVKMPLAITDTKFAPWEKLLLDVVGPLTQTENDMRYVLTCQDNLSKYLIALPLENQTAESDRSVCQKHNFNLWNP